MSVAVAEPRIMAKKSRGRPKGERDDVPVKMDRKIVGMAKAIATARGLTVAGYLSDLVSAPVNRDYARMLREAEEKGGAES